MIICCGEALIDMIPAKCGETGEAGFVPRPGGSVFNTSVALGRLGAAPYFLSCLSTDMFGTKLEQSLRDSNVNLDLCLSADRPTTMAYVSLTNGNASYLFHDENTAGRMITLDALKPMPDSATTLFFGGISLAVEPCAETYAGLAEREGEDRVVMVDPNIRPAFIKDEDRFRRRLDRIFKVANIVKVSDEDLEWLSPGELSMQERAETILNKGPEVVLVTAGGAGVTAYLGDGRVVKKSITAKTVVDTVGAGDSFNAGFLRSLQSDAVLEHFSLTNLSENQIYKALTLGTEVAGVVVSRAGANPPWAEELEQAS